MLTTAALAEIGTSAFAEISTCLITKTDTNPFFVKMKGGGTAAAQANGISLSTFAGKIDGDVESQVEAVETCIVSGAKGILITPTDSKALVPASARRVKQAAWSSRLTRLFKRQIQLTRHLRQTTSRRAI